MVNRIWKIDATQDRMRSDLARVVNELVERFASGAAVNLPAFIARHRQYATEIQELAPILQMLARGRR